MGLDNTRRLQFIGQTEQLTIPAQHKHTIEEETRFTAVLTLRPSL